MFAKTPCGHDALCTDCYASWSHLARAPSCPLCREQYQRPSTTNIDFRRSVAATMTELLEPVDWDTSLIEDTSASFAHRPAFNRDLSRWKISHMMTMTVMFARVATFDWDTRRVTNMARMFDGAQAFNHPLECWDVGAVTNMENMFRHAVRFNQPLAGWDVSRVTNMAQMFFIATAFNQPLEGWVVGQVTNMRQMFSGTVHFNQPLETCTRCSRTQGSSTSRWATGPSHA